VAKRNGDIDPNDMSWTVLVPYEEREQVANLILSSDMTSIAGLIEASKGIMAAVAQGSLSLGVASELREWTNLVYAQLCTLHHPPEKADSSTSLLAAFMGDANFTIQQSSRTAFGRNADVFDADPEGQPIEMRTIPGVASGR
jgi:hypothetical protein